MMIVRTPTSCRPIVVPTPSRSAAAVCLAFCALALVPAGVRAQALQSISSVRVTYNTRKATTNPQGELKAQIDSVDREIAAAMRAGNTGEVRRQLARGLVLLAGTPWTPALDYENSLVVRSERTIVDPSAPCALRIEQIYRPAIELTPAITARVSLLKRVPVAPGAAAASGPTPMAVVRDFGNFDGVARDLRESPFPVELDLSAFPDGAYTLEVGLSDGDTPLGAARAGIVLYRGLDARLKGLEAGAVIVPEAFRADVRYPVDYIRNVNRGRFRLNTFDVPAELASAEAILAVARKGRDPFAGRRGDMERHYVLQSAGEVMPYRVFVPAGYRAATPTPLVIALHGLGGTEDSFFDGYSGLPPKLAAQHGFLMAAPLGYRVDGFYGAPVTIASDAATKRRLELSEKDVLEVLRLMRANYNVDADRIFLVGHSMGAIGTWYLGAKYPEVWAALAPFAGTGSPETVERMKHIPQIVVHGDADPTVAVSGSRAMVAEMKRLGTEVIYIEVPGGKHTDIVVPNLPAVFDFLAAHRRPAARQPSR
jgi:poly(3-hydroxybutyrate) depolymerase